MGLNGIKIDISIAIQATPLLFVIALSIDVRVFVFVYRLQGDYGETLPDAVTRLRSREAVVLTTSMFSDGFWPHWRSRWTRPSTTASSVIIDSFLLDFWNTQNEFCGYCFLSTRGEKKRAWKKGQEIKSQRAGVDKVPCLPQFRTSQKSVSINSLLFFFWRGEGAGLCR